MLIFSIIFAYASWRSRPCVLVCSIFTVQRNCLSVWCEGLSFASQVTPYSDPLSGALEYSCNLFRRLNRVSTW
ncbi:hypothetical protein KC19_9G181700 [Ceratodon purpureus]|uniref:Secreted protein n=1 Tax=Ceratodon purpureus TaxID=3225 RepID=A0A8T0GTA4_CERPU|nr:hypothetical protein KC19_9G181700 [Ceratodon purpureus]